MKKPNIQLRAPWLIHYEKIKALFARDSEVCVTFDEGARILSLYVASPRKADAIARLMTDRIDFGGVMVYIRIVPGNKTDAHEPLPENPSPCELMSAAFDGNTAVTQIRQVSKGLFRGLCYVVFAKEVVQIPADNLGDINGNESTLMETIARNVFLPTVPAYFCTSARTSAGMNSAPDLPAVDAPLGEWP